MTKESFRTMENMQSVFADGSVMVFLKGRVDSTNAGEVEEEILKILDGHPGAALILDADGLEYISSAGLRVLLRLKKRIEDLSILNVRPDVYEVFDMTGFTEMMKIEKAYRRLSVEGCEVIGEGANGKVYRLDPETIIKVYKSNDALFAIKRERELARKAFVLGIPTAIPYDVVRVGDNYGSVFELLKSRSFAKLLRETPEKRDELIEMSVGLLRKIHAVELPMGELPDRKKVAYKWTEIFEGRLPDEIYLKLRDLIAAIPDNAHMLHGDYHMKNIMFQDGEACLIDMDTLSQGDPILEFMGIYSAYVGFNELDHTISQSFLGIPFETSQYIFEQTLRLYVGTDDEAVLQHAHDSVELLGHVRVMSRAWRRRLAGLESHDEQIAFSTARLLKLVPALDRLSLTLD